MSVEVDWLQRFLSRYNPEHDSESRLLRHRAVALQDMAHSFLDHELSEDFEQVQYIAWHISNVHKYNQE